MHDTVPVQAGHIGRVVSVSGSQVVALIDPKENEGARTHVRAPEIGELVRIALPRSMVFGLVSGLSVPIPAQGDDRPELRIMELELIGEIDNATDGKASFRRGVSAFPALGDEIRSSTLEDLRMIYMRPDLKGVRIGLIHQDKTIEAHVVPDDLLGKHFAVLGTTGSGKSCALVAILRAILSEHANARIVILDPHNEYASAFGAAVEVVAPANLELPYWLLNFEEIKELIVTQASRTPEADAVILNQAITAAKRNMGDTSSDAAQITVDMPVPYRLSDVSRFIDEQLARLDKPMDIAPFLRIKERFAALQADSRFSFMFGGVSVRDNMSKILSRIFRIPVAGKPVTVIDTSGVPSEVLNVVVSLLCRMTFDLALWSERGAPILLVCEEAHRYVPQAEKSGFEPTKRALSRIAKEGRKYGVSLCLVSQRPSELASSVLSQCSTIFALRMSNQKDQEFVRSILPESGIGLLDQLPSLRNAEAIAVGEGVPVPTRISFDQLPDGARPRSETAPFSAAWKRDIDADGFLQGVVARWRRQR